MSNTLEPFIRHELDNKPNDVHGRADKGGREDTGLASRSGTLAPDTQRDMAAKQQGNMRPALYYTPARRACGRASAPCSTSC